MVFSSFQFFFFFLFVIGLFFIIRQHTIKKYILLIASIFFYAYWDIRFVLLLFSLSIINFFAGTFIENKQNILNKRKSVLVFGIVINLLVLAFFKYTNFFIENAQVFFKDFGLNVSTLNILLPLGISFFVFELISYLVDVYHDRIKHTNSFLDFLTFVFFFPRLASGPIIRPADFLPQLDKEIVIRKENISVGAQIFLMGMVKKLVIADKLALYVDTVFKSPDTFNTPTVWLSVIAYSIQIYCDLSGYSDMAIGVSKIMGFNLPINFNMPYISRNITEFWRRWHISLSSWLRDYLYIPLGGNRKGKIRTDFNLIATMLLGGLWHGANWTFVIWGGLHGGALVIQKVFTKWCNKWNLRVNLYIGRILAWFTTYVFVCVCWVFFRAGSFEYAFIILSKMFTVSGGVQWIYTPLLVPVLPIIIGATGFKHFRKELGYAIFDLSKMVPLFGFIFVILAIIFLAATNSSPFIYFQF